jgi:hypothetical protein
MLVCFYHIEHSGWDLAQRIFVVTDVSGEAIGPVFRVQAIQEDRIYTAAEA